MRLLLLFIIFSYSSFSWANSLWKVNFQDDKFYLINSSHKIKTEVVSVGGIPKVIGDKKLGEHFFLLIYNAGDSGTSTIVTQHRAVVFNKVTWKSLGDYPYAYKSSMELEQPSWKVVGKQLTIKDNEEGLIKVIKIE